VPEPTTTRPAPAARRRRQRPPAITARDLAAVRWVGEQFGARADLLAVLLGRLSPAETQAAGLVGARTVRHHVDRWRRARLVVREHLLGAMWVTPTRRGLSMAGLDYPLWELPDTQLGHVHAVGVVRLAVEQAGGIWVCERQLRRELTSPIAHPFDGAVHTCWRALSLVMARSLVVGMARDPWLGAGHDGGQGGSGRGDDGGGWPVTARRPWSGW
jgi:hypothetical protein